MRKLLETVLPSGRRARIFRDGDHIVTFGGDAPIVDTLPVEVLTVPEATKQFSAALQELNEAGKALGLDDQQRAEIVGKLMALLPKDERKNRKSRGRL